MAERTLTRNVFVAGGNPEVTYNPRDERGLEEEIREFLQQSGKALSVSGPTKSGKTVLVQRLIPESEAIWLQGSDLTSADAFWRMIVDWYGYYDTIGVTYGRETQNNSSLSATLGFGGTSIGGQLGGSGTSTSGSSMARTRANAELARQGIRELPVPIVIDDFHYVPEGIRRDIARAIKTIIRDVPVVMIAVPHEAFEAVTEEPEMGGRVWHLRIELWNDDELGFIASSGFSALNVLDPGEEVARALAASSFGAPFLMQQLCFDVMISQGVQEASPERRSLVAPSDGWDKLFQRIARRTVPSIFEPLRKGPKVRGQERIPRKFRDGSITDIYGAVLKALSLAGPKPVTPQPELVRVLQGQLEEAARGQHVTSALAQMSEIAAEARGSSDPALVFKNDEVYILDPFLLFYLRYGEWSMESYTGVSR